MLRHISQYLHVGGACFIEVPGSANLHTHTPNISASWPNPPGSKPWANRQFKERNATIVGILFFRTSYPVQLLPVLNEGFKRAFEIRSFLIHHLLCCTKARHVSRAIHGHPLTLDGATPFLSRRGTGEVLLHLRHQGRVHLLNSGREVAKVDKPTTKPRSSSGAVFGHVESSSQDFYGQFMRTARFWSTN